MSSPPCLRWMIRRDLPQVLAIEAQSFEFPWCENEFINVLQQRNCIGMVAERQGRVLGFMVYELHSQMILLLNLAVAPAERRAGVGTALVDRLATKLSEQRRVRMAAEVRDSNLSTHCFLRSRGWRAKQVLRRPYCDCDDDAYLFEYAYQPAESLAACAN